MGKYLMIVLTNPVDGLEDEYNDWYTNRHVPDVVAIPGIISAQRFRFATAVRPPAHLHKYLAIYEIETDDPQTVADELARRRGTALLPMSDGLSDDICALIYEPITGRVAES